MLNIDKFFCYALNADTTLATLTEGRIFDPARDIEDDNEDKIPYLIVTYDSGTSEAGTKDMEILQPLDGATVSVLCVAQDRDSLASLTEQVEDVIASAFTEFDTIADAQGWSFDILGATETASAVMLDMAKPCCYQTLTYTCETAKR